jgi:hypothetical protein
MDLKKFQFEEFDRRLRVDLQLQQRKVDPWFQFDLLSPLQSWQSRIPKTGLKTYTILQYLYRRICIKW